MNSPNHIYNTSHHLNTIPPSPFNSIKTATHNVRSFNDPFKQKFLTNLYTLNQLDIIGLQETNFSSKKDVTTLRFSLPPSYDSFFEHNQSRQQVGFGVGLLIKKHLANHIYKHAGNLGRYIYVDMEFPARFKIRVINLYLSSSNLQLRMQTIKEVTDLIRQALSTDMNIILLGDFNAEPNRPINPSKTNEFFTKLQSLNIFNSCDLLHPNANITHPTFRHSICSTPSCIDHVYTSSSLSTGLTNSCIIDIDPQYSDHSIVSSTILIPELTKKTISSKAIKKILFLYDNTNNDQWTAFAKKTDNLLESCYLKDMTSNRLRSIHNLNFYWNHLQKCIVKAAEKTLPYKFSANHIKDFRPKALKKEYRQLFEVQKLDRSTSQILHSGLIKDSWLNTYDKVRKFAHNFDILLDPISLVSITSINQVAPIIKSLLKMVSTATQLKENEHKSQSITAALEQRCQNFQTDQSKMIDSILECKRQTIILDRCLDNSHLNLGLLISAEDVKQETARHFQHAAGPQRRLHEISPEWKPYYDPLDSIDPSIYNDLMSTPSEDEWSLIINSLPNGKACGPSKISNEMLKHLGPCTSKTFWTFVCACLNLSLTPDAWNLAYVYSIAKPKPWEFNLNNTRPITLLECPRKALVKLINKRLLATLSTNQILKGNNFAGLPFHSTFEPIHILDNLIYDHHQQNHEQLWFLFQDMSKAYDRVNMNMLLKALERLRLPLSFLNFVRSLFSKRFNQVFTAHGNTNEYKVISGIDQGEIISPILWCIYYDPLLARIQQSNLGYYLKSHSSTNILDRNLSYTRAHVPCLAYMDDTLWLSKSKDDLNDIMLIADSFYELNDIKVNWDKSLLLTSLPIQNAINFKLSNQNNIWLKPADPKVPVRYLGIWISIRQNKKFIYQQVKDEITKSTIIMHRKRLTDKQLSSIFNTVILPRILYKIQTTYLTTQFCESVMSTYRKLFKAALHLSISTPQALIHSSQIYNLSHLYDQQLQSKSANLQKIINNPGLLGLTATIRTLHLQHQEWLPSSPFQSWPFSTVSPFKDWWSSILSSMKQFDLSFITSEKFSNTLQGGSQPIVDLINPSFYKKISRHLKRFNLLFLSQITTADGIYLLPYQDISSNLRHSRVKKRPKWFDTIETTVLADIQTRTIHPHLQKTHPHYVECSASRDTKQTNYVAAWSSILNNSVVGRILLIDNENVHLQHYTITFDHQFRTILDPCFGCSLNDHSTLSKKNMPWR